MARVFEDRGIEVVEYEEFDAFDGGFDVLNCFSVSFC
jgi:hypothetical protein